MTYSLDADAVLRALPEAASIVASTGAILSCNRPAATALALPDPQVVPGNVLDHVEPPEELKDLLRQFARTPAPLPGAFTVKPSGRRYQVKGSMVTPAHGEEPARILLRFWPHEEASPSLFLTHQLARLNEEVQRRVEVEAALRESEAALQARLAEAEGLVRAKDEFLATVSHELRTPLNAILGWASLLTSDSAGAQLQRGLEVIQRNALAQNRLVEDLLDVSRIITGKMQLHVQRCDLSRLARDALDVVRPSALAKDIALEFSPLREPFAIEGDPDRLQQCVWNLLSNAVKFTQPGGTVVLELEATASDIALAVTDTGCGIEGNLLPYVFDRFRQGDSTSTRRTGGLGLGLAIVRHIAELHGGRVSAASDGPGRGARFTVRLPVPRADRGALRRSAFPREAPSDMPASDTLQGVRVLFVDDHEDARELVATILRAAGAVVALAGSASAGRSYLAAHPVDVLISDVGMPGEDGLSFVQTLRSDEQMMELPALAVSAYGSREHRTAALAAGFDDYLGKPVRPEALVDAVASLVKRMP